MQCFFNSNWKHEFFPFFYVIYINFFFFLTPGCQDGQLCQMSDTVQLAICNVCYSLHKLQAGSLPHLVSVICFFVVYHSQHPSKARLQCRCVSLLRLHAYAHTTCGTFFFLKQMPELLCLFWQFISENLAIKISMAFFFLLFSAQQFAVQTESL